MKPRFPLLCSCVLLTAALTAPASTPAPCTCTPGTPTAASNTWDFKGEANTIFQDIETDARSIRAQADRLESYQRGPELSWASHADHLNVIRDDVNDMGKKLCRLEVIRGALAPWQQGEVDRIAGIVPLLANETEDAILFGGEHQQVLWLPVYQKDTSSLYENSNKLAQSVNEAVKYAGVSKDYHTLRHEMGTSGGF
ncbi:MAG TPA: hypothetical protein VMS37_15475 [Verrucomicrobiae bacterium]|nr:hypothetical protein [Verrucomicrobiae bacterium]